VEKFLKTAEKEDVAMRLDLFFSTDEPAGCPEAPSVKTPKLPWSFADSFLRSHTAFFIARFFAAEGSSTSPNADLQFDTTFVRVHLSPLF
jgi:hypothetical protein